MSIVRPNPNGFLEDFKITLFDFTLNYVKRFILETSKIIEKEQKEISQEIEKYDEEHPEKEEIEWDEFGFPEPEYSGFDVFENDIIRLVRH